ncbi:MAG: transglutaminase family protein [Spirochaetes bacterium]|nr:transglutaminase family protein [Spirochaetota bacterium]
MAILRKKGRGTKILFLCTAAFLLFLILPGFAAAQAPAQKDGSVIYIQGEMNSRATVYVTKRISSYSGAKGLMCRLFYPESYSSGLNTQKVSDLYKSFTPYPTGIEEFVDEYGNRGAVLSWDGEIRIVQLDLQFKVELYSNFYPVLSNAPYPVILEDSQAAYLESTELVPSDDLIINYIGRTLSRDLYREIDVVQSVFLWLDRNIGLLSSDDSESSALLVLKRRAGDERGICNLACSLLKGLGIPARVVYGISFQKEIPIETPDEIVVYDLPNRERYWVEVFFPDLGWAAYDPHGMYLSLPSHVIKMAHAPDSSLASEVWNTRKGEFILFKEFIYDINSDEISLSYVGSSEERVNKLAVSPPVKDLTVYSNEPDLSLEPLASEEKGTRSVDDTLFTENTDISRKIDIVATRNRVYAQQFIIDRPVRLSEVRLPLIKFSDDGRIWIEVFSDQNGRPSQKLFRTYSINSSAVRHMMEDNPWLVFPVGKNTQSDLLPGAYWIALRSSGDCIFNWYTSEGNTAGGACDSRFMDVSIKKSHWNNILNYDMNYQIGGEPID